MQRFIEEGIWENGHDDKYGELVKSIKVGDRIAIKSTYTRKYNLPFDNIYNLFARIYINGTSSLIKRGFNRYYIQENEGVSTLKGKINISDSIKKQTFCNGRMICEFDNFSEDIKLNQIVKSIM